MFHTSFGEPPHAWCARAGSSAPGPAGRRQERPGRHRAGQRLRQRQPSVAGLPRRGRRHAGPVSRRPRRTLSRRASPQWGTARRGPAPLWQPGPNLPMPLDDASAARCASTGSPRSSACAKPIGARSKTPRPCARAAEGGLPDRILVRAHRLADREQLPAQLQGWTRSALAVLAALFALALFSGIGLALGALGDGAARQRAVGAGRPAGPARADLPAVAGQLSPDPPPPPAWDGSGWVTRKLARAGHGAGAPGPAQPVGARRRCAGLARSATCSG